MLNIKKVVALSIISLVTLACVLTLRIKNAKMIYEAGCIKTSECFPKTNDFSIVNILSLQFR